MSASHRMILYKDKFRLSFPRHRPIQVDSPSPLDVFARHVGTSSTEASGAAGQSGLGYGTMHPHEHWAAMALQLDGEETVGRCNCLQYLLLAETILFTPLLNPKAQGGPGAAATANSDETSVKAAGPSTSFSQEFISQVHSQLPSWLWWALRVTSLHQQLLAGKSPSLLARAGMLVDILQAWTSPTSPSPLQGCPELQGALSIEIALLHYRYGHVEPAQKLLVKAGQALGLEVELSGRSPSVLLDRPSYTAGLTSILIFSLAVYFRSPHMKMFRYLVWKSPLRKSSLKINCMH